MAALFVLQGCGIHPLPEDVTGVSTYEIVRQNRCETRQAVIDSVFEYLAKGTDVDQQSRDIGASFASGLRPVDQIRPALFKGHVHNLLALFWATGVAYNYTLVMTEINNFDTTFDLLKSFGADKLTAPLNSNFDRQRQNTRTFTVTDTFGDLVNKLSQTYCNGKLVGPNYVYPITGQIGVGKMVHAFVYLSLFGNLGGKSDNPKGPPTLVDALEFQTVLSGSAAPKITFSPLGSGLSLADATFAGSATRKDVHTVVIGLALDKAVGAQLGPVRNALFGRLLTASGGGAALVAANAVDQFLTQQIFSPRIVVSPFGGL